MVGGLARLAQRHRGRADGQLRAEVRLSPDANRLGPPATATQLEALASLHPRPHADLIDLHRTVGAVTLPDVGNGYFVHHAELVVAHAHEGEPHRPDRPLTRVHCLNDLLPDSPLDSTLAPSGSAPAQRDPAVRTGAGLGNPQRLGEIAVTLPTSSAPDPVGSQPSGPAAPTPRAGVRQAMPALLREVGIPYLTYLGLHSMGWSNLAALVASAVVSGVLVVLGMVREHRIGGLGLVVLITLILSIVVTLITGDARVALARDAVVTGGLGLAFLGSVLIGKPLMFHLLRTMAADAGFSRRWDESADFRWTLRVVSLVWGVGLLLDAAARVVLALTLPVATAATAISGLTLVTVVVLLSWMLWFLRQRSRTQLAAA